MVVAMLAVMLGGMLEDRRVRPAEEREPHRRLAGERGGIVPAEDLPIDHQHVRRWRDEASQSDLTTDFPLHFDFQLGLFHVHALADLPATVVGGQVEYQLAHGLGTRVWPTGIAGSAAHQLARALTLFGC